MPKPSFHSINIPSEWGRVKWMGDWYKPISFHSINIPSEWGPEDYLIELGSLLCFHSINIPSEWGHPEFKDCYITWEQVSIQLISPASGDSSISGLFSGKSEVSIQLISPASGDDEVKGEAIISLHSFHSINIPSEWGQKDSSSNWNCTFKFPFN